MFETKNALRKSTSIKKSQPDKAKRADALDALRGIAILAMILSGSIPFKGDAALPAWMYHAQLPPPDHIFNPNLPGITWVDLVFPFFLFAMGAAIPLALSKKADNGVPKWKLSLQALQRGLLLAAFAIYIQHTKPYAMSANPDVITWVTAIAGFLLLFPILGRFPWGMSNTTRNIIKTAGFSGAIFLLFLLKYPNGSGFLFTRSDIIILVLANAAFFGTVIWIFTQNNILLRLSILPLYLALRLTQDIPGTWNHFLWHATPADWLYKMYYLQYLFIVIPGTIAGDLILKWMKSKDSDSAPEAASKKDYAVCLVLMLIIIVNLWGLFTRALIFTATADMVLLLAGYLLLRKDRNQIQSLFKILFQWGAYWLILGLSFEAFEGGIKKDKSTLSYYFITTALAIFFYIILSVITDVCKKKKILSFFSGSGQNPMIAYIAGSNLIMPLLALSSAGIVLNYLLINPWLGFLKGVLFTSMVAFTAWYFTRKNIFWRS